MSENDWVCSKCGRPYGTEAEAVACYNSHPKATKAAALTKKYKMRFIGAKNAPSQMDMVPLKIGAIYELPARYAKFAWWEPIDNIPGFVAPKPGPAESVFMPPLQEGEAAEAEKQFRAEVTGELPEEAKFLPQGPIMPVEEKGDIVHEGEEVEAIPEESIEPGEEKTTEKKDEPKELTREILQKWNKESLVNFIKEHGGEADQNLLKAQLVDLAFELQSKSS